MKKLFTFATMLVLSGNLYASENTTQAQPQVQAWTCTFTLKDGTVITHQPDCVVYANGGLNMRMGRGYQFGAGSSMNGTVAKENGALNVAATIEEFRAELSKLGDIVSEK